MRLEVESGGYDSAAEALEGGNLALATGYRTLTGKLGSYSAMAGDDTTSEDFVKNYDADKPRFILGYLTHHLKIDEWTFSFWENDGIRPREIRRTRKKLLETFYLGGKLKWRPDSPEQERLLAELGDIPTVTNDKIYKAAPYQAFNVGKATGKDADAGKQTLVARIGVDAARRHLGTIVHDAITALTPFGPEADTLREAARYFATREN